MGDPRGQGNSLKSMILRLAFVATIHVIWGERNDRIFKGSRKDFQALCRDMEAEAVVYV